MVLVEELSDVSSPTNEANQAYSYDDDDDDGSLTPSMVFDQIMGISLMLPFHEHPVYNHYSSTGQCDGCPELRENGLHGYNCNTCGLTVHKECAESSPEINHPSHQRHPLMLLTHGLPQEAEDDKCRLCGEKVGKLVYHCSICDFSLDLFCARNPLSLVVYFRKGHEHTLTLMPRLIRFTCNACGLESDRSPYICPQCDFMIHEDCIYLPRVISIIRHEHRISRTYFLGSGDWKCGVCRRRMDGRYGAYSCSICPDYAVHSRCAMRRDVWDGRELEDEPEDIEECEEPFRVVSDGVINHFSHREHDLRLEDGLTNRHDENIRCRACVRPVYANTFYSCMQCDDFILHETCANLPRKKRHVLHNHQLTLYPDDNIVMDFPMLRGVFLCSACRRLCSGFRYECCNIKLDVRCGSISEPFFYECHPHPLFQTSLDSKVCVTCKEESDYVLTCMDCDYILDFKCATLPPTVRYKYDRHPLKLCYDGDKDMTSSYWCEICEKEMDQNIIFYTCESSGPTIHIECVLGDFRNVKPRLHFEFNKKKWEVALNGINRPGCYKCGFRCKGPFVAVSVDYDISYVCSLLCLWKGETLVYGSIRD
ncbi:Protein kinase C-like phorbol ester/diacylglycerol-binding domain [Arabidopsis suecica]|uniref:Protein kinase C-like phorbol ester/diacylglycerol-binding domain n=1 Tax=Arabidopsis suecica TaxID=45249 RepID=A0A8T2DPF6_ARASU|nr:Protein kinase C-like phorbol ester/diacylglycerol-binding domain [Arabidopsis suecica]